MKISGPVKQKIANTCGDAKNPAIMGPHKITMFLGSSTVKDILYSLINMIVAKSKVYTRHFLSKMPEPESKEVPDYGRRNIPSRKAIINSKCVL